MRLARLKRIVRRGASAEAEGGAKDQETIVSLLKRPDNYPPSATREASRRW